MGLLIDRPLEYSEVHADRLLRDSYHEFPLDFVGIFAQKSNMVLFVIFGDALGLGFMNLLRVTAASRTAEMVLGALENPFHRAERDMKIPCQLLLRDRLPLIAFMDALPGF